jgi:hypothetical protein
MASVKNPVPNNASVAMTSILVIGLTRPCHAPSFLISMTSI